VEEIQPVPEPEWILDRTGSGPLYWRRESPEYNSRHQSIVKRKPLRGGGVSIGPAFPFKKCEDQDKHRD
jgi:hypothetical protein